MRNAAEMALAEFNSPNIQLLVKDDAGIAGRRAACRRSRQSTKAPRSFSVRCSRSRSASSARWRASRNIPVIAFSTDANVASRGVYLLSFLPETDVARIVQYAASTGKRSYAALIPDNPYGTVVEAAFKQDVDAPRRPVGRARALPARQGGDGVSGQECRASRGAAPMRLFIPDGGDARARRGAGSRGRRRQHQADPALGHRALGRSAHLSDAGARWRLVRGAGRRRLSQFRQLATPPASSSSRCGPRRSLTMRSRSSPLW